jgi:hypothetical protein
LFGLLPFFVGRCVQVRLACSAGGSLRWTPFVRQPEPLLKV